MPEQCELVQLRSWRRKVLYAQNEQTPPDSAGREAGDIFLSLGVVAAEVQDRRILRVSLDDEHRLLCYGRMLFGDPLRECAVLEQRLQTMIQQVDAGEVMQNPLVNTQRRGGETVAGFHFHQAETAERPVRRQRAPVRFGEGRQRQPEGGVGSLRMALSFAAAGGQMGIHFHARAQQEHVAFEGAQSKKLREAIDRRRLRKCNRFIPTFAGRGASQELLEARQFGCQRSLVRLGPQHFWFGRRHTVMNGPVKAGGLAAKFTAMGLSTPSTRRARQIGTGGQGWKLEAENSRG